VQHPTLQFLLKIIKTIMRTITGTISASVAMLTENHLVQIAFGLLTFYLIYRELKSDKELSE
jgi:hypothetical protein